jgi:hypothetical protein
MMAETLKMDIPTPLRQYAMQRNVDWYRFWLKGEEDPDPSKAEQYKRWRELRKLQDAQTPVQKPN